MRRTSTAGSAGGGWILGAVRHLVRAQRPLHNPHVHDRILYRVWVKHRENIDFFRNEGLTLGASVGSRFEMFFYLTGAISLLAGAMGILDYVSR